MEAEIRKIKTEIKNEIETEMKTQIKGEILNEIRASTPSGPTIQTPSHLREEIQTCLREEKEREKRRLNLCIRNLPERNGNDNSAERSNIVSFLSSKLNIE